MHAKTVSSPDPNGAADESLEFAEVAFSAKVTIVSVSVAICALGGAALLIGSDGAHGTVRLGAVAAMLGGALAVARRHHRTSQWLAVAALAVLIVSAAFDPARPGPHALATFWTFLAGYFGVILLSRRAAAFWILGMATLLVANATQAKIPIIVAGHVVDIRWLTSMQFLVSVPWFTVAWHHEMDGVRVRDAALLRSEVDRLTSVALHERVRRWRQVLVRTHETVLNDIRYVLDSPHIDRLLLRRQLVERDEQIAQAGPQGPTIGSIVAAIAMREGLHERIDCWGGTFAVSDRCADVLRSALLEVVRNAIRHANAQRFSIEVIDQFTHLQLRVHYVGDRAFAPGDGPGIGSAIVLRESLASVGGTFESLDDGAAITMPTSDIPASMNTIEASAVGRAVIAVVPAGNAVGGLVFVALLMIVGTPWQVVAGIAASIVSIAGALVAVRRAPLPDAMTAAISVLAASAPFALGIGTIDHELVDLVMIVVALTGYGLVAMLAWSRSLTWWWSGAGWLLGVAFVAMRIPAEHRASSSASIIAALSPVALAAIIFTSLRVGAARTARRRAIHERQVRDTADAEAALEVSMELQGLVTETTELMHRIADGVPIDESTGQHLRCLDGALRATLQVEPRTAGTFLRVGRNAVLDAVRRGIPVRVLAMRDSGDTRPLPDDVCNVLDALLGASTDGMAVLQAHAQLGDDMLLVTVSAEAARRAGVDPQWSYTFDDGHADIEFSRDPDDAMASDDDDVAVLVIQRTAQSSTAPRSLATSP